ncbi:LysM peptidoglycan-binding domain-containing protein [Streptococcus pseudopneumoniae]|uniref:LysM peptidoglycan-binding domain-containing protein n=1 Tax=Streptococcus pseudopneumoniae TaxID=257758 RepID=A0ABX9P8T6_9STRE|nr:MULTISPECIES: LysM domain-containing protein [Streptococcus]KPL38593.1 peptidoglycan-binding protein LysM [Streptococcus pseudopneumoniae]MBF9619387.1 LysM peptidoglycan-binding domain-containing protein [Streptococcus pseudopneumoniae]MBF9637007.1 LysM peptidoglycan-binding domain-containing protein [Streptococcus pseudopneumoniae]MBF9647409.1 LysM peptidoglycan-binding domain-containing protein [Streptococcus pseudopneumoniae]MBF9649384.1 LysM peptidoglycan-binding domain-containing prote
MKKRILLASTVALSFAPVLATQAEEVLWTARSVEQIQNDLTKTDNKTSYTVQYGDTLSTIAEALGVDVTVLANLNKITNMDLIFPETVLTTTVNEVEEVTEVEIQTPQADSNEEVTTATADLTTNQVTVDDQTVQVADLSQPIAEAPKEVSSNSEVTETVTATEEVTPSTGTSVPEEQTAETSSAVAEAAPQAMTPAEKDETQASTQAESAVEATTTPVEEKAPETTATSSEAKEVASSNGATPTVSTYQPEETKIVSTTYTAPAAPDYAGLAVAKSENAGLQPQTAAFKEEIANLFGITFFSGYRPGDSGDHGKGLAIDFIVPESSELGDKIAEYAIQNMASRGISYIIWKQRFYAPFDSKYGPANTWNPMPDRGSVTENHYDHVHVSMNG